MANQIVAGAEAAIRKSGVDYFSLIKLDLLNDPPYSEFSAGMNNPKKRS